MSSSSLQSGQIVNFEQEKCYCDYFQLWVYVFAAYKGLLLVFGIYLAYDTRQIKVPFLSDSRFMTAAVYTTVAFCVMLLIFLHVAITDPAVYYVLMSAMVMVVITTLLLLIFVPKVFRIRIACWKSC